jgi:hypothetical protein
MTTDFVKNNIGIFITITQNFSDDARFLVIKLSQAYNLEVDNKMPMNTFLKLKNQMQSGFLDDQWTYFFHGNECRFKHKNGQITEVILNFEDEYGALDPFFLGKYIKTNPKYPNINTKIKDEFEDGLKIMEVLQELNLLLNIENNANVIIGFENNQALCIQQKFKGVKLNTSKLSNFS